MYNNNFSVLEQITTPANNIPFLTVCNCFYSSKCLVVMQLFFIFYFKACHFQFSVVFIHLQWLLLVPFHNLFITLTLSLNVSLSCWINLSLSWRSFVRSLITCQLPRCNSSTCRKQFSTQQNYFIFPFIYLFERTMHICQYSVNINVLELQQHPHFICCPEQIK